MMMRTMPRADRSAPSRQQRARCAGQLASGLEKLRHEFDQIGLVARAGLAEDAMQVGLDCSPPMPSARRVSATPPMST
jgi:hypothetical protein